MFKIFTDTSANLPMDLMNKYDVEEVPLHYTVNDEEFPKSDGKTQTDFDGKMFYDAMRNGAEVITHMINISAFTEAFEKYLSKGIDVIYIGMSSGLSGTYHAALKAAEELKEKYIQQKIATIDTLAASLGEGLPVLFAAKLKDAGKTFEETVLLTEQNSKSICQYFTVEDLMYLKKGGRISGAVAILGNMLQIKPILKGDEAGMIVLDHKEHGRKKALDALVKKYQELVSDLFEPIGIAHGDSETDADYVAKRIRDGGHQGEVLINCYEPVTGSHVGPGTVALFFYGIHR